MGLERWLSSYEQLLLCRGPGFVSHHPYCVAYSLSATPAPGVLTPSAGLCGHFHITDRHTGMQTHIHIIKDKSFEEMGNIAQW